jgi:predicted RecA/RadA family phage recombinase
MAQIPSVFLQGNQDRIDYTPSGAVTAGDVVALQKKMVGIALRNIEASATGALAITGVFKMPKTSAADFYQGDTVYWDETATPEGGTVNAGACVASAAGFPIGRAFADTATADTTVKVIVFPQSGNATS